jgi:hypothetical protein
MVMGRHFRKVWGTAATRARGLERQLRAANGGNRAYVWGLPAAALVLCFTILVVAGVLSGASPFEILPIAIFEGLVISGIFIACMLPPTGATDNDQGDWGPGPDPAPDPPPSDPGVWVRLLADSNIPRQGTREAKDESPRELAGTRR